ncbi:MAG: hypothetical protein A2Z02_07320 [Chloroflexi bacterium RBG_16_48_7]|nr:MAG: hypothetical protein A2Z02_07320 [Chloroflexi bacterium RBG_16_48_7]
MSIDSPKYGIYTNGMLRYRTKSRQKKADFINSRPLYYPSSVLCSKQTLTSKVKGVLDAIIIFPGKLAKTEITLPIRSRKIISACPLIVSACRGVVFSVRSFTKKILTFSARKATQNILSAVCGRPFVVKPYGY